MRGTRRRQSRKQSRKHRRTIRGGGWGFDGVAGISSGGVPLDARTAFDHCAQRGGCNCRAPRSLYTTAAQPGPTVRSQQRGGSNGGYGFVLNNDLGKVYANIPVSSRC